MQLGVTSQAMAPQALAISRDRALILGPTRRVACTAFLDALKRAMDRPTSQAPVYTGEDLEPELMRWLQSEGAETDKACLRMCGLEGRGLVARRRIRRGERVLAVPGHLVIDANMAAAGSSLRGVLSRSQGSGLLSEWAMITVFLAEIWQHWKRKQNHNQQQQVDSCVGSQSEVSICYAERLSPYLSCLPETTFTALDWTPEQVNRLLSGSPLKRRALAIQAAAKGTWLELKPLVEAAEKAGDLSLGVITEGSVTWALGIMLSRAMQLSSRSCIALSPWADMANHSPSSHAHLDWQDRLGLAHTSAQGNTGTGTDATSTDGGVVIIADRDYDTGQQIYISYGDRPSGHLLLSYGFTPSDIASHPHESVALRITLHDNDPMKAAKAQLLYTCGLPITCEYPIRIDGLPQGLLPWAAFCAPSISLPPQWQDPAKLLHTLFPAAQPTTNSTPSSTLPTTHAPTPTQGSPSTPQPTAPTAASSGSSQAHPQPVAARSRGKTTGKPSRKASRGVNSTQGRTAGVPSSASTPSEAVEAVTSSTLVEEEVAHAKVLAACGELGVGHGLPIDLQEVGFREVAAVCSAALKGYTTTLDQDRATASTTNGGDLSAVCAAIRVRERQILQRTEFVANTQAREIQLRVGGARQG